MIRRRHKRVRGGRARRRWARKKRRRRMTASRRNRRKFLRLPRTRGIANAMNDIGKQSQIVTMEYRCDPQYVASGTDDISYGYFSQPAWLKFRANSVYDPNYTSTGIWNTVTSFYNYYSKLYYRYQVLGSSICCTIRQGGTVQSSNSLKLVYEPMRWGITIDANETLSGVSNWVNCLSHQGTVSTVFQPDPTMRNTSRLSKTFIPSRDVGGAGDLDWENLGASFGAHPNFLEFFHIWIQNAHMGPAESDLYGHPDLIFDIYIRYKVKVFQLKDTSNIKNETLDPAQPV